ncbi:amino acid ABC transporter permease [Glycomyces sp. TRM65418]|uniref:amino acid ABC transporter permease n=1 Tax=Glycomyces sp. TRM65418 TaxID=2867006 RepID=UPI001CE64961|nr:amino acid ABC transporter permease [Glycomyces sp. TRM65418]MCC3762015.1 amino acid ABC transporter permease [Glycomyces sp. TRM65418]QZD56089.1 amino acid ABC transporter permease [Glycomyces sp. TRM65418]
MFENFDLMADALLKGMWTTVWVTLASYTIALVIGVVLVVMHVSPALPARWAANAYTQLFRNVPLLAVLIIMFFGLPQIGIKAENWVWALLGLGMYTGAFVGETMRSGINSIPLGQAEAARSIGLTFSQSLGTVIMPQAIRAVIPPLGSLLIALVKNSALVLAIGVAELTARARRLIEDPESKFDLWGVIIGVTVSYLLIALVLSYLVRLAEKRAAFVR